MAEGRQLNRTWLCSVLFTDLVNYSSQSVETQIDWKAFFNRSLGEALKPTAIEDRVILDTGDGAAVCFLGDPEAAILSSLAILNDFRSSKTERGSLPRIRLGIHLGPVKLVQDINGNLNAIGDGINVGQRIMSFASENQILVSRPYFEVVSRLSDEYSRLFRFEGVRQDKHVREHTVYAIVPQSSDEVPTQGLPSLQGDVPSSEENGEPGPVELDGEALQIIETSLRELIGPIAQHVVRVTAGKAKSIESLCEQLAETALPGNERHSFLTCCRERLGSRLQSGESEKFVPPPAGPVSGLVAKPDWDEAFLSSLKKDLTDHIGPVAKIVLDRAVRKANTRDELLRMLAEYIPADLPRKR